LPLPDHPPEVIQEKGFEKRHVDDHGGSRTRSHSGSVERRQRTEALSRPPPPESPPALSTPMSPKSDDENTFFNR